MKPLRLLLAALLLLPMGARAQELINCIQLPTPVPCSSANQVGAGTQGDPAWLAFGKANAWFNALSTNPSFAGSVNSANGYNIGTVPWIVTSTDADGFSATCFGAQACSKGLGAGIDQTYLGYFSGGALNNTPMTAGENSMVGFYAGGTLTSGSQNACIGAGCMWHETTGAHDVAIGSDAMRNTSALNGAIAIGWAANRDWINTNGIAIGTQALAGQFQIDNINFTASINISGVMNVTAFTTHLAFLGGLTTGQLITGSGVPANAAITGQLTGTTGGIGTYQLNGAGTGTVVTSTAMLAAAAAIGTGNIAIGSMALQGLGATTASNNLGIGSNVMTHLTTASYNNCVGNNSCDNITTATDNTVAGGLAASGLTTGSFNVFNGYGSGFSATTGAQNTCSGWESCFGVMTGTQANAAFGYRAGNALAAGVSNSLFGAFSGLNAAASTGLSAFGYSAGKFTTGSNNTIIGYEVASTTLTSGTDNILIGTSNAIDTASAGTAHTIQIGGSGGNIWSATGTDVPSTSASLIAGTLEVAGGVILDTPLPLTNIAPIAGNSFLCNPTGSPAAVQACNVPPLIPTVATFTIASGCSNSAHHGGENTAALTSAGDFTSGVSGTCAPVFTFTAATNGYICSGIDMTTGVALVQTASSTTNCTISGTTVSGNLIKFQATGY